jgi:hypothetical protein
MKLQFKSSLFILILILASSAMVSCKKFVEIPLPADQPTTATIFSDDQTATTAINGLYSSMMTQNFSVANSGITLYPALSADELLNTQPDANAGSFTNNTLNSGNSIIETNFWRKSYNHIYLANSILNGLSNSSSLSVAVKNNLTGEAKFVRAFCYFNLINLFNDVPYITTTDYEQSSTAARTSRLAIYNNIVSDLQEAQNLMSENYPTQGKVRPNKWAAAALLARVYLYLEKWPEAEQAATAVINSAAYNLSALNDIFKGNSSEAIWQLLPVLAFLNTADGFTFIPYSSTVKPQYILTDWLVNSFEPGDQRKVTWVASNTVGSQIFFYPFKYKVRSGNTVSEYNMLLRLAEVYLIRSEARTMQNNILQAQSDLNIIRNRAGLPNTAANSQPSLLIAIEHERQIELFSECGHRWFDLKRTGRINTVLSAEKIGWLPTAALYPIPFNEIQANPNLTQNPGY